MGQLPKRERRADLVTSSILRHRARIPTIAVLEIFRNGFSLTFSLGAE